ncbi:hypothetical protein INT47_007530 [Mucor saturninus]|uniref:F-box domain-containing protein n=1 Tax=Mucor saturninus TaxID=64648 RepID=A0A8H7V3B7_9FUNG|nr:hypothetical protein INT47_007530 [Mucor saturninus]
MVSRLPFELIEQIDRHLCSSDRYQLVLANRLFYRTFITLLYRSITIQTNKEYKQLINVLSNSVSSPLPLGRYTHTLQILLGKLDQKELEKVQQLCPNVQSVHIDGRIWHSYLNETITDISMQQKFLSVYGSCKLSCLTLDLFSMDMDIEVLVGYTPNLRNLTIMGIYQVITVDLVESIGAACMYLQNISLDGIHAEAIWTCSPILSSDIRSFKLKCQFGADRYQDWLPYISMKYPKLVSCYFHHAGQGKDLIVPCSAHIYRQFIQRCPLIKHMGWHNIEPDFQYFQQLDQMKNQSLKQLDIYDTISVSWLLSSSLFGSCHSILQNVVQLRFGSVPQDMSSYELILAIHQACPQLVHLSLAEPKCNLSNPFRINHILEQCQRLQSLELDYIVLRVSMDCSVAKQHPLKSLTMRHCSSFNGVFDYMSPRCLELESLSLFAHLQKDRRHKVQIHMPYQKFKTVTLHGLRTESYDAERRIRFFSVVAQGCVGQWRFMQKYEIVNEMERAEEWKMLTCVEKGFLESLLEGPPTLIFGHDIHTTGYVDFVCKSVERLYLNKKLATI